MAVYAGTIVFRQFVRKQGANCSVCANYPSEQLGLQPLVQFYIMGGRSKFFYDRIKANLPVPGVFLIRKQTPVGQVVEALELILAASDENEWAGKLAYVPL